jgi:hypothetical protein
MMWERSGGLGRLPMARMARWQITITCRDGSRLRFSELRRSAPKKGEIVQTADAGQIIKARIDACHKKPEGMYKGQPASIDADQVRKLKGEGLGPHRDR